jgi:OFA family oxalate/formate antiporter-like MFS transporter
LDNIDPGIHPHKITKSHIFYGYIIITAAFFIIFAAYGVRFSYGVFFKPMAEELGYDSATTSAAFSISMLLEGVFSLVMGGMADRFGPRKVLMASSILVGAGYCLMPLVHSFWQLYLFYGVILGVGMGGMFVPIISMTARWFTARRSLMTGIVSSGAGIGILVIPPSAAIIIERYGWRSTFLAMGIAIVVIVLLAAQFLKADPAKAGAVPYGEARQLKSISPSLSSGFSFREALKTSNFWVVFITVFWYGFYSSAINVHIVPDAINSGMAPTMAANILSTSGALIVIGRLVLGSTADRTGNKRIFIFGFILSIIALLWIILMHSHWVFFILAVVLGFAQGGLGTSQSPLIASLFGLKSHGLIFGCIGLGYTIGASLGPYLTGYIFDLTGSYEMAFIICLGTSILALVCAFFIRPVMKSIFTTRL